ncbi:MAG TPA: Uma2 family endonuclease [Planctomycetaceae bacterium]|nr:Uma2 family endonuclease [Planctomycetaceae bacterium]
MSVRISRVARGGLAVSAIATDVRYTPEDLLEMPGSVGYELVDGRLVEREMSALSSRVGVKLSRRLDAFADERNLGEVFGADCSYQCFRDEPDKVRKPGVSFIARGKLPLGQLVRGHVRIPPDLAAEVVSPNDLYTSLDEKVEEYREAGVRLIWVINPGTRTVVVHRADGTTSRLTENDELFGEDVLPGFRCRVGDLFPSAEVSEAARNAVAG